MERVAIVYGAGAIGSTVAKAFAAARADVHWRVAQGVSSSEWTERSGKRVAM
jgi:predicted dinucleotide-binding enzyme